MEKKCAREGAEGHNKERGHLCRLREEHAMSAHDRTLLSHLLRLSVPADPDATLLTRWIEQRDQQAFAALVARHGPMVLGVCRRLLGDVQHAEDAFQAAFLVLARRAPALREPELLGNWLYGVALRTARKARTRDTRRQRAEERGAGRRAAAGSPP